MQKLPKFECCNLKTLSVLSGFMNRCFYPVNTKLVCVLSDIRSVHFFFLSGGRYLGDVPPSSSMERKKTLNDPKPRGPG